VGEGPEITVWQLPKFQAEAAELIGTSAIEELAAYLIDHPSAGDVIRRNPETAMGSEGQGETWRRPDHLPVRRGRRSHLPDSVLRQEHEGGPDGR
jgi:hypothetical protein